MKKSIPPTMMRLNRQTLCRSLLFGSGCVGRALSSSSAESCSAGATVGFVGSTGIMGTGMYNNILEKMPAGVKVAIWNRDAAKSEAAVAASEECRSNPGRCIIASSPEEVVSLSTGITISMLPTPEAADAVFPRLLQAAKPGKALIDCATLRASDMERMSQAWTAAGGRFLEAPVSGSKGPAAAGALVFLTAGDHSLYEEAEALLDAMGKRSFFFGDAAGQGTRMKLVVNKMMVEMMATLGEGMELAGRAGLPQDQLVQVLQEGAMANPMFGLKGPKIIADDHAAHFPLKHARKDLLFGLELAEELGQGQTDMGSAAKAVIARAVEGDGQSRLEDDFSALTKGFQN